MTAERKQAGITAEEFIRNKIHEKFYIPAGVVIDGMSAYAIGADTVVMWAHEFAAFKVAEATKEMRPKAELKVPTKEEIINHFTKEHYHYQEGRYTRVDKDRIFGAQWAINWIKENNK